MPQTYAFVYGDINDTGKKESPVKQFSGTFLPGTVFPATLFPGDFFSCYFFALTFFRFDINSGKITEELDKFKSGQIGTVNCTNPTKLAITHVNNFFMKLNITI